MNGERRGAQRYRLARPVRLTGATGITRDISTTGVFFETAQSHSVGDAIRLSVDFGNTTLQCEGSIVRVEKLDSKFGVAVELTSYIFA